MGNRQANDEQIVDSNAIVTPIIEIGFDAKGNLGVQSILDPRVLALELQRWADIVRSRIPPPPPPRLVHGVGAMAGLRDGRSG